MKQHDLVQDYYLWCNFVIITYFNATGCCIEPELGHFVLFSSVQTVGVHWPLVVHNVFIITDVCWNIPWCWNRRHRTCCRQSPCKYQDIRKWMLTSVATYHTQYMTTWVHVFQQPPGASVDVGLATFGHEFNAQPWNCPVISETAYRTSRINYLGI